MGELIGLAAPFLVAELTPTLQPDATPTPVPFSGLEVQIISVTTQTGQIKTQFRLYNGGASPVPITPDDLWLALGYVENPSGPQIPAEDLAPFTLLPGQAADMTLVWLWQGEPYGSMGVGEYRFAVVLTK